MENLRTKFFFTVMAMLIFSFTIAAKRDKEELEATNDSLKAVLIMKFAHLIEWPDHSSVSQDEKPVFIGVLGDTNITQVLIQTSKTRTIRGKKVKILQIPSIDHPDLKSCNVLFISRYTRKKFRKIIRLVHQLPILTIGDTRGYESDGIMINLFDTPLNNLRFNVNCKAAKKSGIELTSKIVRFAKNIIQ